MGKIIDISDIVRDPKKHAAHITSATGRTQAIKHLVINPGENARQQDLAFAWSYALHHIIKTADKRAIATTIAPYAVNPLYKNYPQLMIDSYPSSRAAYQQARETYCREIVLPIIKQLRAVQVTEDKLQTKYAS